MSVRQPVRLLDISRITEAYPLELLADFATGNFTLLNSSGSQIEHKKPGKITVKYGQSTIVNNQDLSENIEFTIPESTSVSGNAATATKLQTPVTITVGNTGKSFDGSAPVSWSLTEIGAAAEDHNHDSDYLGIDDTAAAATKLATARTFTIGSASAKSFDGTANLRWTLSEIGAAAVGHNHDSDYLGIDDTAAAATKLATARTLTIGNTGKSFNGTANVSWTLTEIGAAAASHTHSNYLSTSGGTVSGDLTIGGTLTMSTDGDVSGISVVYTATIGTSWSGSGPYTQTITVTGILATDVPVVDMRCSGTYSTDQSREEAFGQIYRIVTAANRITVYAHEKTTTSCPIRLLVVR